MKVKFNQEARIDGELAFEKDSTHNLSEASAMRWVRRGMAEIVEPSKIEEVAGSVKDKVKDVAHKIADSIENVASKEEQFEPSEGATRQEEVVANNAHEVENKKAKPQNANKNSKGL